MGVIFMILPEDNLTIELIKKQRSNYGKKNFIKKYHNDLQNEFNSMYDYLPDKCKNIVDIGCGLCGISVLLHHCYDNPFLWLIDKDEIEKKPRYGFTDNPSYYNSFDIIKKIMDLNEINNYKIVNPENDFSFIKNIDIVISILACGFHFPVYFYFGRIFNCLNDNGILILDIRKEKYKEEISEIELYFKKIEEIKTENPKTIRIFAKEKICLA
jgi:hypothetical protein